MFRIYIYIYSLWDRAGAAALFDGLEPCGCRGSPSLTSWRPFSSRESRTKAAETATPAALFALRGPSGPSGLCAQRAQRTRRGTARQVYIYTPTAPGAPETPQKRENPAKNELRGKLEGFEENAKPQDALYYTVAGSHRPRLRCFRAALAARKRSPGCQTRRAPTPTGLQAFK